MYLNIIFLPLLSFLFCISLGRFIGIFGCFIISLTSIFLSLFFSFIAFFEVCLKKSPCYIEFPFWFDSGMLDTKWGFMFDSLTCVMLIVVFFVSFLVHLYSTKYMEGDPHLQRFISYLSLFTFFMIILVTADNFFQMFVGWEGVGICSYLLINFWYNRLQANKAALKAVIVNRFGDLALGLGTFIIFSIFKTLDYNTIFCITPFYSNSYILLLGLYEVNVISIICFFLFIAVVGKSAQILLHTWLADAMEGPTPVSALIHAATMVTAGVFLILRCSPLFQYTDSINNIIMLFGALTALMASTIGVFQHDLKKVIAYSTCSQLGYMVLACGLSGYDVGIFHLSNHAFFKALLFLSAGSIIHGLSDEQDMRKMGGLLNFFPLTYSMFLIGSFALMGIPFLSGFYSKDLIIELAYGNYSLNSSFSFWLVCIAAFFTSFYSIRLIVLTFLTPTRGYKKVYEHVHEPHIAMIIPLLALCVFSIFIGFLTKDMMIGLGSDFWNNSFLVLPYNYKTIDAEFISLNIKLIPLIVSLLGSTLSFFIYNFISLYNFKRNFLFRYFYDFFNRKWYFDYLYNYFIVQKSNHYFYNFFYLKIDRGLLEYFGPYKISQIAFLNNSLISSFKNYINNNKIYIIYNFVFVIFFNILFIYVYIHYWNVFYHYLSFDYNIFFIIFSFIIFFFSLNKIK